MNVCAVWGCVSCLLLPALTQEERCTAGQALDFREVDSEPQEQAILKKGAAESKEVALMRRAVGDQSLFLQVLAAQLGSEEELARQRTTGAKKQVLLIIAGLVRTYHVAWPRMVHDLIEPNEAAGYEFKIVLNTNLDIGCDKKEFSEGTSRKCDDPMDRASNIKQIRAVFAPRQVHLVHQLGGCQHYETVADVPRSSHRQAATWEEHVDIVGSNWCELGDDQAETLFPFEVELSAENARHTGCAAFFNRVYNVLTLERNQSFDKIIALRPDVQVVGAEGNSAQISIDEVCSQKPGLNFIDHNIEFDSYKSLFHNRDTDFMHLFCPGDHYETYRDAMSDIFSGAPHWEVLPLPPGFVDMKKKGKAWNGQGLFGRFASVLYKANITFTNLDESYLMAFAVS